MATTPNYGWVTPAPTDFVTDLPADFETFADAVDADLAGLLGGTTGQVLAKDSNSDHDFSWVTTASNPITTEGDLVVGDNAGAPVRLPIGSAGTYLSSDGTTASWAGISLGGYTLINAGGTALTGAATITVSGISGYNDLFIYVDNASSASASSSISVQFNTSSTGHYTRGARSRGNSTWSADLVDLLSGSNDAGPVLGKMSNTSSSQVAGYLKIEGTNSTAIKPFWYSGGVNDSGGNQHWNIVGGGYFSAASVISSVSLKSGTGNFDAGTLYVYGR